LSCLLAPRPSSGFDSTSATHSLSFGCVLRSFCMSVRRVCPAVLSEFLSCSAVLSFGLFGVPVLLGLQRSFGASVLLCCRFSRAVRRCCPAVGPSRDFLFVSSVGGLVFVMFWAVADSDAASKKRCLCMLAGCGSPTNVMALNVSPRFGARGD